MSSVTGVEHSQTRTKTARQQFLQCTVRRPTANRVQNETKKLGAPKWSRRGSGGLEVAPPRRDTMVASVKKSMGRHGHWLWIFRSQFVRVCTQCDRFKDDRWGRLRIGVGKQHPPKTDPIHIQALVQERRTTCDGISPNVMVARGIFLPGKYRRRFPK